MPHAVAQFGMRRPVAELTVAVLVMAKRAFGPLRARRTGGHCGSGQLRCCHTSSSVRVWSSPAVKEDFTGFCNACAPEQRFRCGFEPKFSWRFGQGRPSMERTPGIPCEERKRKKPGACEQGLQAPGDSLLCAWPTLRRSFQICRGREVAALLRPWLRRSFHPREGQTTFSGGFFSLAGFKPACGRGLLLPSSCWSF